MAFEIASVRPFSPPMVSSEIGAKAVKTANVDDLAIGTAQVAANAITGPKILDGVVDGNKLGVGAVMPEKMMLTARRAMADADFNPTGAELVTGFSVYSMTPTLARNFNLPGADTVVAAFGTGVALGNWVDIDIVNLSVAQNIAIMPGAGWTTIGLMGVVGGVSGHFRILVTGVGVPSCEIIRL